MSGPVLAGIRRRELSMDILAAAEAKVIEVPDRRVLEIAAQLNRVVISCDRNTMVGEFYRFIADRPSPGLVIVPQRIPIGEAIRKIVLMWAETDAAEFRNLARYLSINGAD